MTDREKLIELLTISVCDYNCAHCKFGSDDEACLRYLTDTVADYLIANGVTFASDNNVGKWIPVTERLPELIPCDAGTAYSEAVSVLTTGRKVLTAIWDGMDFIADAAFWEAEGEKVTHWAPVLLPLPEPPKGE